MLNKLNHSIIKTQRLENLPLKWEILMQKKHKHKYKNGNKFKP